jgi:hypothetical protein
MLIVDLDPLYLILGHSLIQILIRLEPIVNPPKKRPSGILCERVHQFAPDRNQR